MQASSSPETSHQSMCTLFHRLPAGSRSGFSLAEANRAPEGLALAPCGVLQDPCLAQNVRSMGYDELYTVASLVC